MALSNLEVSFISPFPMDSVLGSERMGGAFTAHRWETGSDRSVGPDSYSAAPYLSLLSHQVQRCLCKEKALSQPWSSMAAGSSPLSGLREGELGRREPAAHGVHSGKALTPEHHGM